MEYILRYGFVRGGKAYVTAKDSVWQGKNTIHYFLRAKTVGLADKLYKVDDIYESLVDAETNLPCKAVRSIREGKYRYYNEVLFDHDADSISSERTGKVEVPDNLVDMLGLFFYMRKDNFLDSLSTKELYTIPMYHNRKFEMMNVKYFGKETIKTKLGKVECFVVSPRVDKGKVLNRNDGLIFYITTDEKRLPVYMEFDMKVGAVKCELVKYKRDGVEQIKE